MKRLFLTGAAFFSLFAAAFGVTAQEEEQLVQQALALFDRASFTASDSAPTPRICGTASYFEAKRRFNELSPASQVALSPLLFARPTLQTSYAPPSGRFRIHYSTTGPDAVRNPLIDVSPLNGIPDWVDTVAAVLDSVWDKEVVQMGFRAPLGDGFYPAGGDNRFDVYLAEAGGNILGFTAPDSAGLGPLGNQSTAFIVLDNDFNLPPYNNPSYGIGPSQAMRVTAAHEFFHAIQFAYNVFGFEVVGGNGKFYWQEASAVWMEQQMYPQIEDYIQYLPYWFGRPELSFRTFSTAFGIDPLRAYRPYAMGIYGIFLSTRFPNPSYGYTVVRRVWENMATVPDFNLFAALDAALSTEGSSFRASLREFYQWNYFTGPRSLTAFYGNESAFWPTFNQSGFPGSRIDSVDVYPTRFPSVVIPCGICPPDSISFFCAPCAVNTIGFPCSTKCPPICTFVPYQPADQLPCLTVVEDLGASYISLQNVNARNSMSFDLLGAPNRPTTWFAAAAGYDSVSRTRDFLSADFSVPSGQIPDMFFDEVAVYNEVVLTVVNDTVLPVDAARKGGLYAFSATDSSAPPAVSEILNPRPNPFRPGSGPGHTQVVRFPVDLDSLSGDWEITIILYSPSGEIVYQDDDRLRGGASYNQRLNWDGNNLQGEPVASGIYFGKIQMQELGQSRRIEKVVKVALIR